MTSEVKPCTAAMFDKHEGEYHCGETPTRLTPVTRSVSRWLCAFHRNQAEEVMFGPAIWDLVD